MFLTDLDTQQPVIESNGEGETDEEFQTAPRVLEDPGYTEHPRVARMAVGGSCPAIKTCGMPKELVRLVTSLTQWQRQDVIDIGMGDCWGCK